MVFEHFESLYPDTVSSPEISQMMQYIKEGTSCQLIGIPGVGRSTLLGLLAYNKSLRTKHLGKDQESYHFVIVNFSEIRKRPLVDAIKFIFLSLSESLRDRALDESYLSINALFKESLGFADELVLFQGLKQAVAYLALEKKLKIVFLFDRFEEYVPTVSDEFFINLRTLRSRAKFHFSVIFSLTRPLETVLDPTLLADFYEFVAGHIVYQQLSDNPTTQFRIGYLEKITHKKLPPAVYRQVQELTGGHGKLMKLSVESLFAHEEVSGDIAGFLLEHRAIQAALSEIWNSLSPAEQADIREEKFEDSGVLEYLEQVGLVRGNHVQIPLLTLFLKKEAISVAEREQIVYDDNTNSIRKGETILSDHLTSSEFRLLRYFLLNQDRIIDREELIAVVWEEMKSTAGITDQAVDQLVFRLRRKIEEDANQPTHLLTVKGRGFRFVS